MVSDASVRSARHNPLKTLFSVLDNDHDIHVLALATKRLPESQWSAKVASIQQSISEIQPDIAILGGVKPHRIPEMKSLSGHYIYSKSGIEHWDLKLSPMIASQSSFVE